MLIGKPCLIVLLAAAIAAPGIANAGSTSSQCASLKADWRAIHDNIDVMHQETTMRFAYAGWCGNARNLIRAADHILFVATHDPSRCRQASDNLDRLEVWKNKLALHTEGCP